MNKTIKDISLEIGSGITPLRSNELYWNSPDIPWIKTEQLGQYRIFDSMEYISDFALEDTNIRLWSPHTVSVAMYGEGKTRGNVSILMIETTTNQACCNIKVNDALADYRFLYYWLKNNYENLRALSAGVRKNLNSDDIKNFPFPENSLSEQEKIADILSVVDDKIELNSKICSELEAMAKTLYDYWFVQFDFPDENGEPYRTAGGEMVWNEQLKREIPKGWKTGTIRDLGTIVSGGTPNTSCDEYYCTDGYAWITPNDLSGNTDKMFINHGERDVTVEGIENSSAVLMPKHTILLSTRAPIGYLAISENEVCTNQGFKSIVPDSGYSEFYIYYVLKSNIPAIAQQGVGTTFKEVSKETLSGFKIPLPPIELTERFAAHILPVCTKRKLLENECKELTKLRDWLLPMLMNGQARVE